MRLDRRHRLLLAGDPRLMGSNVEANAGTLHAVRHGGGEAHILIAGNDVDAVLLALAMQLGTQRLPDAMRDDGIVEGVGELRRGQRRRRPIGDLLGLVERLVEHHGSQRGERDAATTAAACHPSANAFPAPPRTTGRYRRERDRCPPAAASSPRSGRCGRRRDGHGGNRPVQPARAPERDGRRPPWRRSHRRRAARCAHRRRPPTARWSRRRGRGNDRAEKPLRDRRAWRGRARRGQAHPSNFFLVLLQSKNSSLTL